MTASVPSEVTGRGDVGESTASEPILEQRPILIKKDGLRSWLMCFFAMSAYFVVYGLYTSYGLFFVEFLKEFERSEAETGKTKACFKRRSSAVPNSTITAQLSSTARF